MRILLALVGVASLFLGEGAGLADPGSERFQAAIHTLSHVPKGLVLIKKALKIWKLESESSVASRLKWGDASRTDTVLTRHYNPKTGQEDRERQVTIYLREDQSEVELVLDLAHELVHATSRPSFDPYDPTLTSGKYIWAALEGEGGEVDAVITECEVGLELSDRLSVPIPRCKAYLKAQKGVVKNPIDREKVRLDFYRVGKWEGDLVRQLGVESKLFPLLNERVPKLYSSTGHAPYPIALLKEFEELTELACNNTRNRMRSVTSIEGDSQEPGLSHSSLNITQFMMSRCR